MSYQFSYMKVWQGQKTGIKLYLMLWMVEIDNKCSVVFFWDPCKLLCYTSVKHNFLSSFLDILGVKHAHLVDL